MALNSSLLTLNRQRAPENSMKHYKPVQNSKKNRNGKRRNAVDLLSNLASRSPQMGTGRVQGRIVIPRCCFVDCEWHLFEAFQPPHNTPKPLFLYAIGLFFLFLENLGPKQKIPPFSISHGNKTNPILLLVFVFFPLVMTQKNFHVLPTSHKTNPNHFIFLPFPPPLP